MASKESGLEVNADKTMYMVKSRDQNAGRSHSMKIEMIPLKGGRVQILGHNLNTLRTGSFKLFKRPFPKFLTILTL